MVLSTCLNYVLLFFSTIMVLSMPLTSPIVAQDNVENAVGEVDQPVENDGAKEGDGNEPNKDDDGEINDKPRSFKNGFLIEFEGPINRFQNVLFQRKLKRAKQRRADLIVIEIESPGGTVEDSLEIAERLRDVDWAYTVAYIPKKALSGAAMAALGCDEIIMKSTGRIGDVGVIFLDDDFFFKYVPEKIRSDIVHRGRDLATAKGRSPELVEAMIDMDVLVYQKNNAGGKVVFETRRVKPLEGEDVGEQKPKQELDLDEWTLVPESGEKKFLILNGPRAVELEFANGLADDRRDLGERLGMEGNFTVLKRQFSDSLAYNLNLPLVTILLLATGIIALLVELGAPGISVGGILSALCFGMFFWSRFLVGTAGALEIVMFTMGVVFILLELFVIPGFGVPGLLGLFLLVSSLILASQDFVVPSNSRQLSVLTTGVMSMLGVGVLSIAGGFVVVRFMGSMPVLNKLMLEPPSDSEVYAEANSKSELAKPDHFPNVGQWGEAESVLRPAGKAKFGGETFDVVADGFVDNGTQVKVVEISGNVIHVSSDP